MLGGRLASILSQIEGAGEVDVLVTVESDGEKVIATETTVEEDGTVVTVPVFSGGEVVVLEEKKSRHHGRADRSGGRKQPRRALFPARSGGVRSEYKPKHNQSIHKGRQRIKSNKKEYKVMSKTKKIVIMSGLVLLLAVTAVFNFVLAGSVDGNADSGVTAANYFSTYRTERTTTRNEELLQLDSILESTEAGSSAYEEAMALKLEIVGIMERELLLETYIKSLGYSDAVVSIGLDSDNVNVFVNATELAYNDFLSIYNILTEEAGCDPANVNIMPINSES